MSYTQQRVRGIVKHWQDAKGFGFITPADGGPDIFFHISEVNNSRRRDLTGQRVTYIVQEGNNGKPAAGDVQLASAGHDGPRSATSRGGAAATIATLVALAYLAAVGAAIHLDKLPVWAGPLYIFLSWYTYAQYRADKTCALNKQRRTPEQFLHLLELAGGWPGGLIAQWTLRHKNRKDVYQFVFWVVVAMHVGAVLGYAQGFRMALRPDTILIAPAPLKGSTDYTYSADGR